jgi:hypothetical protein
MPPISRPLSAIEQTIHKECLEAPNNVSIFPLACFILTFNRFKTLTQKDIQAIVPDASAMLEAINFLLATVRTLLSSVSVDQQVVFKGLFKAMQGADKKVMFKAIQKEEMKM